MKPTCPKCKSPIPDNDINVAANVAFCRACNTVNKLSEIAEASDLADVDTSHPPAGVTYGPRGGGAEISWSHRSIGSAIGALLFGLFWNGILSVFIGIALLSTMKLMHVSLPGRLSTSQFNGDMGLWGTIGLWIFLLPFMAVGLFMIAAFVMAIAGRTEIRIEPGECSIFSGVGKVGWRRRFNPANVKQVRVEDRRWHDSDGDSRRSTMVVLEMETGKPLKFGAGFKPEQRNFVAAVLKKLLTSR